ncbi:MAG: CapA family protein [Bacilli bacterium]|nr:CapA family protein [Bacilli bacterium]
MKKRKVNKTPLFIIIILICLIFGALYFFRGHFTKKEEEETKPEVLEKKEVEKTYNLSFTLAGNILINSGMWNDARTAEGYDFSSTFKEFENTAKKSNINFYFQQSIVGGSDLGASLNYNYNSPKELLTELSKFGFNLVSLSSYHSYDKGIDGINNTILYLNENKMSYSGINEEEDKRYDKSVILKNGVKVGLISYTMGTDEIVKEEYAVNKYSDEQAKKDIEELKKNADIVIVSIDWNNIGSTMVTEEQKRVAKYLSDLGVNIIVGNTGYSIQPIEKINDTLVFYSLGNLLSGHNAIDSRISSVVDFNLKVTKLGKKVTTNVDKVNVLLTYAYNNYGLQYKVIPFTKIINELGTYKTYYEKYNKLLTENNDMVKLYEIGE